MSTKINTSNYNRQEVNSGILHIGVGNFHRAHQAFYTNELLKSNPSQLNWGICGAMLLPSDEALYRTIMSQDCLYTLTVCGRDGVDQAYEVGSIVELLWSGESKEAIVEKIANIQTKIITLTITEGGYNIDKATGEFILATPSVAKDIESPLALESVFGYIAEGLRRRMERGNGGITILSCDNLQHNGDTTKRAFMSFFNAQDTQLTSWVEQNVTFPNSMVDRITPATKPEDIERLKKANNSDDMAPVYAEDFIQWVIEDNFAAGRPAWEEVGVEFTKDVTLYEQMKLSLLNASHTLLSYPSFLAGFRKVDDAMHDQRVVKFVRTFMDVDVTPLLTAPENTDLEIYKQTLIERFANRSVSDQIARLCYDGLSKFPVYIVPNLKTMLELDKDTLREAYLIAAYRHYLKYQKDDSGETFEFAEPWMNQTDMELINSDNLTDFLSLSAFEGVDLKAYPKFVDIYSKFCLEIREKGAMTILESIL